MVEADLAIVDAAELVTVAGPAPRIGQQLRDISIVKGGCVAVRQGAIVFVGTADDYRRQVRLHDAAVTIDAA